MEFNACAAGSIATEKEQGWPSDWVLLVGDVQMPQRTTNSILNLCSRVTVDGGVTETKCGGIRAPWTCSIR